MNRLVEIAREYSIVVMAGLLERDGEGNVYNTYVAVRPEGYLNKYRKLHHSAIRLDWTTTL